MTDEKHAQPAKPKCVGCQDGWRPGECKICSPVPPTNPESPTIKEGRSVNVCAGPHCGANGCVDFVDEEGERALVDCSGNGLTWISFNCIRAHDGSPLRGGAVLRKR